MSLFVLNSASEASRTKDAGGKFKNTIKCMEVEKNVPKSIIKHIPSTIETIKRYRQQIMVYSVCYYKYDESLISDFEWARRARILIELQLKYPTESKECIYYELFKDFDGSTGFYLINNPWAIFTAKHLLIYRYGNNYIPENGW